MGAAFAWYSHQETADNGWYNEWSAESARTRSMGLGFVGVKPAGSAKKAARESMPLGLKEAGFELIETDVVSTDADVSDVF